MEQVSAMEMRRTREFKQWFQALAEDEKVLIAGGLRFFEKRLDQIAEPSGERVESSRHCPAVFVVYPGRTRKGKEFIVFCALFEAEIVVLKGYDANHILDRKGMVDEIDRMIDNL